jgi:hypothetical protein
MIHEERGDQMTPDEIGEYVAGCVRKSIENGGSAERFLFISGKDAPDICHIGNGPDGPANAALIVKAVNAHEQLLQTALLAIEVCKNTEQVGSTLDLMAKSAIALAKALPMRPNTCLMEIIMVETMKAMEGWLIFRDIVTRSAILARRNSVESHVAPRLRAKYQHPRTPRWWSG